jgi:hypothetical protein
MQQAEGQSFGSALLLLARYTANLWKFLWKVETCWTGQRALPPVFALDVGFTTDQPKHYERFNPVCNVNGALPWNWAPAAEKCSFPQIA